MSAQPATSALFISPSALLDHWQGHRRLTRRVIQAFPEDKLFTFSVGGMRPFSALALEMISMAVPMVRGTVTEKWDIKFDHPEVTTRGDILRMWDESTNELNELWPRIPPAHFQDTITAFGQYTGKLHDLMLYVIDNEIHHRAQGYVYLRALNVEPPPFWERG